MKLSKVEELVKAMREYATEHGHADPNVAFWMDDNPIRLWDITENMVGHLSGYEVDRPGGKTALGDFHLRLFRDE